MGENLSPGRRGRRTALAAAVLAALAVFAGLIAGRERLEERWLLWRLGSSDPVVRQGVIGRLGGRGRAGVLGAILADEARPFPARLRDATAVGQAIFGGREWAQAERAVVAEGWGRLGTGEVEYFTRHLLLLPKSAAVTPGGFQHQVHCLIHVDRGDPRPGPSAGPGRVESVEVRLVARFNRRYDEVVAASPYPKGSLPDLVLDLGDVRLDASRFPVLKKVELSCGKRGHVSEDPSYRIFVGVELERTDGVRNLFFGAAMKDSPGGDLGPPEPFGTNLWWREPGYVP